jgi:hypothetical protein
MFRSISLIHPSRIASACMRNKRMPVGGAPKRGLATPKAPKAEEVVEEAAEEGGSLAVAVGTTFVTYMIADFLSNFIQHPTQLMDYGIGNKLIGRDMDNAWWGTRTEHIVGVAACLAVADHASQSVFSKYLGKPLCFAKSPAAFVAHTFIFIFGGVAVYVLADGAFNPDLEVSLRVCVSCVCRGGGEVYIGGDALHLLRPSHS